MKDSFETFVRSHPRDPLPQTLTWEATDRDTPSRAHWIVIDKVSVRRRRPGSSRVRI